MKKIMLLISLLFTINLSASSLSQWNNVDVLSSGCQNFSWTTANVTPDEDICHDIYGVSSKQILYEGNYYNFKYGYLETTQGYTTSTYLNHEGNELLVYVDVFGVPGNEPTVMYKYRTLPAVGYSLIINSQGGNIVNGFRYYFYYSPSEEWGSVNSGDIIVKNTSAEVVDTLHVK